MGRLVLVHIGDLLKYKKNQNTSKIRGQCTSGKSAEL